MARFKINAWCFIIAVVLLTVTSHAALGAAVNVKKQVTPMEGGNYLIKLQVTASGASIYALSLIDPKTSIVDVYAPKGWCVVTDGGDYLARTGSKPIESGKTLEFLIHSSTDDIQYTYTVFDRMKQLGKSGTI